MGNRALFAFIAKKLRELTLWGVVFSPADLVDFCTCLTRDYFLDRINWIISH